MYNYSVSSFNENKVTNRIMVQNNRRKVVLLDNAKAGQKRILTAENE